MAKIFGIDISKWQKGYDYKAAKEAGVKFAILRAGYATTKDTVFETHYKGCRANGIDVGAYWFSYATTTKEAKAEAKAFLKAIKGKKFEYPIYMDVESEVMKKVGEEKLNDVVRAFAQVIEDAGYYFGVYTNVDWYKHILSGKTLNKSYDWWIASWSASAPKGVDFGIWQFGGEKNKLRSTEIAGVVTDQNYAYKDYPSIMKKNGLNGYEKETTSTKPKEEPVAVEPTVIYFKKYTGNGTSFVDALKSIGASYTYLYRLRIAIANGIKIYPMINNASQNTKMLNLLKKGKLIKP